MSPIILPSEICSGPSTSKAGMRQVVRAMLSTLAMANSTSDTISGSFGCHSNRAACVDHDQTQTYTIQQTRLDNLLSLPIRLTSNLEMRNIHNDSIPFYSKYRDVDIPRVFAELSVNKLKFNDESVQILIFIHSFIIYLFYFIYCSTNSTCNINYKNTK